MISNMMHSGWFVAIVMDITLMKAISVSAPALEGRRSGPTELQSPESCVSFSGRGATRTPQI